MGARKDQSVSYSRHTQEEVEAFCTQWGIDLKFNPVAQVWTNLSIYVQLVPLLCIAVILSFQTSGLARVLHFEVVCRAAGYDPSLLSFRRFFCLAKNDDWFTLKTSQVEACLISSMVTTLGFWKDWFFWVSESIVPFKMVWRHPDAVLNELEPSESELDSWFLKSIRASSLS
ncbi:hypothetical protein HanRHA438_Chr11g0495801 [Helianthus annuus]|nr:hypothetical protein HanHA300_Chr11g0395691 [Helianthus annuus]KAJ0508660.1 hypothetical protein HanIR_Chr11g0519751 [Helianthus annuus]KAJ0684893.1 hypothetical protein HanLR1_Chr11g0396361 [Helianthus annuus]KAJ0688818.1 hypothetical protein HanOQP8_Chr11g0398561 [Helianthus annuus]KAJ0870039.1 hypothetical protein HanRHA438_Chr11g0495801 [Helianthus annuus]